MCIHQQSFKNIMIRIIALTRRDYSMMPEARKPRKELSNSGKFNLQESYDHVQERMYVIANICQLAIVSVELVYIYR